MPLPTPVVAGRRGDRLDEALEQSLEDGQRQACSSLTVGRRGESATGQEAEVINGGVAVEDLDEEPVDQGRRGQMTDPPTMTDPTAGLFDGVWVEPKIKVLPERAERVIKESMHREGLRWHGSCDNPHDAARSLFFAKLFK